ncbi:GNAT family N-acetyltransferase [Desulfuribacillus stibiiarsenatis]|uniref:GNAT family N-acetyltransferase n=1 Tax=Desulfuribacillus stibiiarsenatis TaxID=1390249 RepID=A0A1E5LAC5_9FIRM|nr:GNAT family N-acetyltransferase [Desulfuribacillus stibiiarsenatis]OEH86989.1 GNAT family N-acetyltransferase [Desulfuribacillus stibiiarsenatis]
MEQIEGMDIRPVTDEDLDEVLHLFYQTVHTINAQDYRQDQLDTWAPQHPDKEKWLTSLRSNIAYVIKQDNKLVGFADLNQRRYIDRLFVHKDYQRMGIASLLVTTLEAEAKKLKYNEVMTEASITARGFFEKKGYDTVRMQDKELRGMFFRNYIMKKEL